MSNRSARLRHPGTVGGSNGPRISRPRRAARCEADRPPDRPTGCRRRAARIGHAPMVTVEHRALERLRVSGASAAFAHDSLSIVNVPRRCCRPGCPHYAVATLTFVYSDSTAVVGPLATVRGTALVGSVRRPRGPYHRAARMGTRAPRRPAAHPSRRGRPGRPGRRGARGRPDRERQPYPGATGTPLNGFRDPHMHTAGAACHRAERWCDGAARATVRTPSRASAGVARSRRVVAPAATRLIASVPPGR